MPAHIYLDLLAVLAASCNNVAAINFIEGKGCGTIKKAIRTVYELKVADYQDAECVIVTDTASYRKYKASLSSKSLVCSYGTLDFGTTIWMVTY